MTNLETIYMPLLDEGIEVSRPVLAERLGADTFRVAEQEYNREDEHWAFEPGTTVVCTLKDLDGEQVLRIDRAVGSSRPSE